MGNGLGDAHAWMDVGSDAGPGQTQEVANRISWAEACWQT